MMHGLIGLYQLFLKTDNMWLEFLPFVQDIETGPELFFSGDNINNYNSNSYGEIEMCQPT